MRILILHHDDLDGEAAAAVVIGAHADDECGVVPMNYKDRAPLSMFGGADAAYIVDFSLGEDEWAQAIAACPDTTWIDHHASAIRNATPMAHALPGIREEGQESGCLLAWRYLFTDDDAPRGLELISDYDTWTHAFPESRAFKASLEAAYDTRPCEGEGETWGPMLWDPDGINDSFVETVCDLGQGILRKTAVRNAGLVAAWGFPVNFSGLRGIALNRNQIGSDAFESVAEDYDILLPFVFDGQRYTVSIYRGGRQPDFDCARLAEEFVCDGKRGGGHPGAAGFQCRKLPWDSVM